MAYIGDVHQVFMAGIVNNSQSFQVILEDHDVEIIESFLILKECSRECLNVSCVSIVGLLCASDSGVFPNMNTLDDMCSVSWVLSIVDDSILAKHRYDLRMEEYHITDICIE